MISFRPVWSGGQSGHLTGGLATVMGGIRGAMLSVDMFASRSEKRHVEGHLTLQDDERTEQPQANWSCRVLTGVRQDRDSSC